MPRTTTAPAAFTLTPDAARRAIYLDFEGFVKEPPSLLGVLIDGSFETLVLDPTLRPAAEAKGLRVTDGTAALRGILERARLEDRIVCAFGNREREAALEDFGVDLGDRYVNVHPIVKRSWKLTRPERPKRGRGQTWSRRGGFSLEFFEKGLGLVRPPHLGHGHATKRLRGVRQALERHGVWSGLTPTAKAKWTKLLDYNETDVRNLAALAGWVAARCGVLEAATPAPEFALRGR